ncbi:beta-lactamase regulator AmpE [Shewanella sp. NIFS-20-20]|uniref:beta-lactamase regulator AmpE n=1 Tax=Shewanella sp. NIFS-20-20 TaxID=2853806 RepID=UPI001C45BC82|nr:beta-lactamase regulator AmpE [Shewanella sp. NIFS-20-20]MBV7316470.1 beta-lactamase regulator AmpE [Shewanella sp. NIFS-20-20]
MALFSFLVAILVERFKVLPLSLQFDQLLTRYHQALFGDNQLNQQGWLLLALVLPSVTVAVALYVVQGLFWGALSLVLWVVVAILCFSHLEQRQVFKRYIQAACRGDLQACYHYAGQLDCSECLDAVDSRDLGLKVGQSVAWINYRYYGAIALFFILLGPIGAVFYCTVRYYDEERQRRDLDISLVERLLFVLDWLPSRLFSFGFALCGEFNRGFSVWRQLAFNPKVCARQLVAETAMAAQVLSFAVKAPESLQVSDAHGEDAQPTVNPAANLELEPTLAMLALSKRNFILLVTLLSLLTIFGVVN